MKKFNSSDGSITKNLKIIEWLKSELLESVSGLFRVLLENNEEKLLDLLSNIIMATYLLANRLGFSFQQLDRKIEKKIKVNIEKKHQIEVWYGDLSSLLEHLRDGG